MSHERIREDLHVAIRSSAEYGPTIRLVDADSGLAEDVQVCDRCQALVPKMRFEAHVQWHLALEGQVG